MAEKSENRPDIPIVVGDLQESHAPGTTEDDAAETSRRDELRAVLAGRGRRRVLRCLRASETPMALADLADEFVRRVADVPPTAVQDEREEVYTLLYHYHLPKLAESDLVSFDPDRKLVDLRENAADRHFDDVRTSERERPRDGR